MFKKRWRKIQFTLVMIWSSLTMQVLVHADALDDAIQAYLKFIKGTDAIKTLPVSYELGIKNLDRFTSKVWVGNDWFGLGSETVYLINSLVQAVFWVNKKLFFVFGELYNHLSEVKIGPYIDIALGAGAKIYSALEGEFIYMVGILIAMYAVYTYFVLNGSFIKTILKLMAVYLCSATLFMTYNGNYVLKNIYTEMEKVSNNLINNSLTTSVLNEGWSEDFKPAYSTKIVNGVPTAVPDSSPVLTKFFDLSVLKPYQYMNFTYKMDGGKVTFDVDSDKEFIYLLYYNSGDKDFMVGEQKIYEYVGEGNNVKKSMLSGGAWGAKFTYAFTSIFDTTLLGLILSGLAVSKFALQMMILLLLFLGGLIALLSMIPTLENILFNFLKKFIGALLISSLIQVGALLLLWMYDIISIILMSLLGGNPFLMAVAKAFIVWYIWKKREFIISILTANRVSHLGNNLTRKLSYHGRNLRRRASKNAMERLKRANKSANQIRRGAIKVGSRKAKEASRRAIQRFEPKSYQDSKPQLYVNSLKDMKHKVGGLKDKAKGRFQNLRAEGVGDQNSQEYHDLKRTSQENLERGQERLDRSLGYRQRKHNLATKQRLKKLRKDRQNRSDENEGSVPSSNLGYRVKPIMPIDKSKVAQNPVKIKPVSKNSDEKRYPLKDRSQSPKHVKLQRKTLAKNSHVILSENDKPVRNPFLVEKDFKPKGPMFVDEKRIRPRLRKR